MGDVVKKRQNAGWQRLVASMTVLAVAIGAGCTSSKPAKVVEAAPPASRATADSGSSGTPASASTEIRSLDIREGAPEVYVDLEASGPLVWTSFRNTDGQVVVELPNALPSAGLADLAPADGLVSSLKVERNEEGSRPMTRLLIETRQEVEHSVTADGSRLQVQLLPVEEQAEGTAGTIAFEPVGDEPDAPIAPAPAAPAPAAASGAMAPANAGTPDRPAVAPAPAGVAATRIDAIEVLASEGGAVIRIAGDGEFPYSTFALAEPDRFVIDLEGVINRSSRSSLPVDGSIVERVRVAQFKPLPRPVSRVVFDLRQGSTPVIERTGESLVVSFPSAGSASMPPASPASQPVRMAPASPAPKPAASQPSDLALAQRPANPQRDNRIEAAIEAEDAPDLPAPVAAPVRPATSGSAMPQSGEIKVQPTVAGAGALLQGQSFGPQGVGEREKVYYGELIDLKVTNADVTDVLRSFAQISGLNVVVQPGVTGVVTAELTNVPWDQALEQILKINNLDFELDGNVMRIAPTNILRQEAQERQQLEAAKALAIPLRTVYQRLSYANADEIARLLRTGQAGLLSQRGSVVVDRRTNALIIKELPAYIDSVISVVDLLDSPEPQVMIEARIIETTKRFNREYGIDWGFDGISSAANGNTTGLVFPNNGEIDGGVNLGGNGNNGVINLRLGNVLNTFQLDVALRAAESEGLITILSAPKVATLNNQRAEIQSGLQIPVQTIANNTVSVQFINATLRLQVTPQVTAEGTILMDIEISKREPQLAFLLQGAPSAPIATKDARTRLIVRDGGTAVIGGIYRVTTQSGENRVPGLANIPIIGHLFKNKNRNEENDELLIFITPRVVKI
jgi:type IV pilus assembly protein PilQ